MQQKYNHMSEPIKSTMIPKTAVLPTQQTKPVTELSTPNASTLDWSLVDAHLDALKNNLKSYVGKKGHNSYLYYKHNIKPTEDEYLKRKKLNTLDAELYSRVLSLKIEAPKVIGEDSTIPEQIYDSILTTPVDTGHGMITQVTK